MNGRTNLRPWRMAWLLISAVFLIVQATAYQSYHDPTQNDRGHCSQCHQGFVDGPSDTLHSFHTGGSDPITTNCNLCHTGSGRDNPLTVWSTGDDSNGRGCAGCHGREYGETVGFDHRGFPISGKPKASCYGLRRHHVNSGITLCLNCHADIDPLPENAQNPPYYARPDVSLGTDALDTCSNEDNDADTLGLDNDGDLLYEYSDPDCTPCTVEFDDFARFALNWLALPCDPFNHYCGGADIDRLGEVDFKDVESFAALWLNDCPKDWILK